MLKMLFYQCRNDKHYTYFRMKIEYTLCFHKLSRSPNSHFKVQQKISVSISYTYNLIEKYSAWCNLLRV